MLDRGHPARLDPPDFTPDAGFDAGNGRQETILPVPLSRTVL